LGTALFLSFRLVGREGERRGRDKMEGVGVGVLGACVLERGARESLGLGLVRNAVFLAERAAAMRRSERKGVDAVPDEGLVRLLSSCYVAAGRVQEAASVLEVCEEPQSRYDYAVVCHRLGRVKDAEAALTSARDGRVHGGAAGHFLMGCLCKQSERKSLAVHHLTAALKLDPLLWVAYEELCGLNEIEGIQVAAVYGAHAEAAVGERMGTVSSSSSSSYFPIAGGAASRRSTSSVAVKRALEAGALDDDDLAPRTGPGPVPSSEGRTQGSVGPPPPPAKPRQGYAGVSAGASPGTWTPASFSSRQQGDAGREMTPVVHPGFVSEETPGPAGGAGAERGLDFTTPLDGPAGGPPPMVPQQQGGVDGRRKWMDEGKLRKVSGNLFGRGEEEGVDPGASSEVTPASHMFSVGGSAAGKQTRPSGAAVAAQGTAEGPPRMAGKVGGRTAFETPATGTAGLQSILSFGEDEPMAYEEDEAGRASHEAPASSLRLEERREKIARHGAVALGSPEEWALGSRECVGLLRQLGEAYRLMSLHQSREALASFARLGKEQYATGWVLSHVGRCRFEMGEHKEAADAFAWSRKVAPARLEGLELYSTALWHLRKEVELSALAESATELGRRSPQAWCCVGNCFSLQREHEAALRFFQRAISMDPAFTYAHTLCGHEYAASEEFEKALACYRTALKLDARHYNAWYGLGAIYQRQEKHELAEYHFRRALKINPRSSVLRCYLGMSMHRLNRDAEALVELDAALEVDPKNPLALFERASVLVTMDRLHDALDVLQALKELAPKESSIFFMMGKIHKRLRDVDSAVACLSTALDLKPSSADVHTIKTSLDRVNALDDDENDDL